MIFSYNSFYLYSFDNDITRLSLSCRYEFSRRRWFYDYKWQHHWNRYNRLAWCATIIYVSIVEYQNKFHFKSFKIQGTLFFCLFMNRDDFDSLSLRCSFLHHNYVIKENHCASFLSPKFTARKIYDEFLT